MIKHRRKLLPQPSIERLTRRASSLPIYELEGFKVGDNVRFNNAVPDEKHPVGTIVGFRQHGRSHIKAVTVRIWGGYLVGAYPSELIIVEEPAS